MKLKEEIFNSELGYILLYTLFISFLITSIILFAIAILFFHNKQIIREINKKKLELACFSAAQNHISRIKTLENEDYIINIDSTMVFLSCRIRGVYYEITAKCKKYRDSSEIVYLFGNKIIPPFDNAVIISYPSLRASVAGNTKITGNILATSNIFSVGNISGISTRGKEFIEGKITTSHEIQEKLFDESFYLQNNNSDYIMNSIVLPSGFVLNNSSAAILDSAKNLIINGDFYLEGFFNYKQRFISNIFTVKGSTIVKDKSQIDLDLQIYSDSSITINDYSSLNNTTLFTKKDIAVKSKCELLNVQMFAEKNISIEDSELKYPSTVGIYINTDNSSNLKNSITIKSSKINGTVMLISSTAGLGNNQSKILIDDKSTVQGLVYCENYVEISGRVLGILYTHSIRFYNEPTEYINWLVNLDVNRDKLNKWFLLPIGFSKKSELQILDEKWIY